MAEEERVVWSETASMRDFLVNVPYWLLVIGLTVGAYLIGPIYVLIPVALAALYAFCVWLKRFNSRYKLTNQRLVAESGIFSHRVRTSSEQLKQERNIRIISNIENVDPNP